MKYPLGLFKIFDEILNILEQLQSLEVGLEFLMRHSVLSFQASHIVFECINPLHEIFHTIKVFAFVFVREQGFKVCDLRLNVEPIVFDLFGYEFVKVRIGVFAAGEVMMG